MAYSEAARERRRCTATRRDGERCRGWAIWDDPLGRCAPHAGRTGGERIRWPRNRVLHAKYPPCRCAAYAWPHRPGGGLCRWPEEPHWRCTIPAGTKAWWRK